MGAKKLRRLQIAKEATAGTANTTSTAVLRWMGVLSDDRDTQHADEDIGYLSQTDRTYVSALDASLAIPSIPATYEEILYILEAGVKQVTTGTADGSGSGKIYTYAFPTTAANTIQTYTIKGGDNQQAEYMEYAFVESFTLEGRGGEPVMMSANWRGRQVSLGTFTGSLTPPTVAEVHFGHMKLYIDAIGGTIGTTQITSTLLAFRLNVVTGWKVRYSAEGNLYWTYNYADSPEITLDLTFEHNANAVAQKAIWRAQTAQLIRLGSTGPALTTAGTTYSNKVLRIDLAGKYEDVEPLGDQDGNNTVTVRFRARYDFTAANFATILVVNEVTAVP